ncbi:hypothetical protein [Mesotoga prima]|uniref:hypothetical protein n=1 Tax=Mesotoga prima TaxID=1184387 RepID=UPI002FDA8995
MTISYKYRAGDQVYLKWHATQGDLMCSSVKRIVIDGVKNPEVYYELSNGNTYSEKEIMNRYDALGLVIQYYREKLEKYVRMQQDIWNETDGGEA